MSLTEFLRVQTRPNLVFNGPGGKKGEDGPATPVRAASPRLVTWDERPDRLLRETLFPQRLPDAAAIPRSRRLQALIRSAAGPQRHEASHAFNGHRAFPSAQSKYPAELFVGIGGTTWHYDSSWDGLRPVGADSGADPWAELDGGSPAFLAVLGRPNRLPAYYRELQWALTLCEEGHLAGMTAQLARALGFGVEVVAEFDDQGLLERIGAVPGDQWLPGAVVGLDGARPELPRSARVWPEPAEPWLDADRQAWMAQPVPPPPPVPAAPATFGQDAAPTLRSWASVMFHRSGGRAPGGLTASPERLPSGLLDAALDAASAVATDWGAAGPAAGPVAGHVENAGVELFAVVERTHGREDGVYAWDPVRHSLELREPGQHLAAVQRAFYYPRTVTRVDTCNVAVCCVADYTAALETEGPRGLRLAQLRFGALMQASAMVCSAHDVFLRPCRSFDPDALGALLRVRPEQTVGYLCLVGRSRYTDLLLDLRPAGGYIGTV